MEKEDREYIGSKDYSLQPTAARKSVADLESDFDVVLSPKWYSILFIVHHFWPGPIGLCRKVVHYVVNRAPFGKVSEILCAEDDWPWDKPLLPPRGVSFQHFHINQSQKMRHDKNH